MGTLFGILDNSLEAIEAFQNSLNVSQNNVSNASTPGYAAQIATMEAQPFDPSAGLTGGVESGPTQSTQNEYANQAVRSQLSQQGNYTAQYNALESIQGLREAVASLVRYSTFGTGSLTASASAGPVASAGSSAARSNVIPGCR